MLRQNPPPEYQERRRQPPPPAPAHHRFPRPDPEDPGRRPPPAVPSKPHGHGQPLLDDDLHRYPAQRPPLKPPPLKRTSPLAWFAAIFCALLWIVVILGGIAVLVVFLVFRPRNPRLDIPQATLNAAYLDVDVDSNTTLLNADLTFLANFSNPNEKVDVTFSRLDIDLYFASTLVAASAVDPFAERRGESVLRNVHMVASQVALPVKDAEEWRRQEAAAAAGGGGGGGGEGGGLRMEVRGRMMTRSEIGSLVKFSYWLHGLCSIVVGAPPAGALRSVSCRTKR
ncbi:hypothetical protein AXF42_Ash012823 [Apostasia shenzhenica]|uniref:Late embryogenesis abundant protein LEA-2 subgroup domain-containing protein n=1 Tax=Apostasia shenzhenica TaxID=1088818 RepID=A0A2I0AMC0_9ASPA|nr:hypothetical protein AXF42_Ash012823 [Apostasia shenzhenica]